MKRGVEAVLLAERGFAENPPIVFAGDLGPAPAPPRLPRPMLPPVVRAVRVLLPALFRRLGAGLPPALAFLRLGSPAAAAAMRRSR